MHFSEAHGRKVVSTTSAETVGVIRSFVVDPTRQRIVALSLNKTPGEGTMLPWGDITGFGADAVTVPGDERLVVPDEQLADLDDKHRAMVGKRVLSTAGLQLGHVRDVDFDPTSGQLDSLLLEDTTVDGAKLRGVGSYAVVVA